MFHFHKWNEVVRKRTTLARTWYGYTLEQHIPGLKVLEVSICDTCGAAICIQSGELQKSDVPYLFGGAVTKLCRG